MTDKGQKQTKDKSETSFLYKVKLDGTSFILRLNSFVKNDSKDS